MLASSHSLEELKCATCDNILSYFPIHISKDNAAICRRCKVPDNEIYFRNMPYEALAKEVHFPCRYKKYGCLNDVLPKNMPSHEEFCNYKSTKCPFSVSNCDWEGNKFDLYQHCEDKHPDFIMRNGEFEMNLNTSNECLNTFKYKEEVFLVKRNFKFEEQVLHCSVIYCGNTDIVEHFVRKIILKNGIATLEKKLRPILATTFNDAPTVEVNTLFLEESPVTGRIKIACNKEELLQSKDSKLNLELLSLLKCSDCSELLTRPIYQCSAGHLKCFCCSMGKCSKCPLLNTIPETPTSASYVDHSRNFCFTNTIYDSACSTYSSTINSPKQNYCANVPALENVIKFLIYPCKYSFQGCSFTSNPENIKRHEKCCLFGSCNCPLKDFAKCNWKDTQNSVASHIRSEHNHKIMVTDDIISVNVDVSSNKKEHRSCYILKHSGQLFKLYFYYNNPNFLWSMQLIDVPEKSGRYRFEIDIIDTSNRNLRVLMRSFCSPLNSVDEKCILSGLCIHITLEQIKPLIFNNVVNFRVQILK